MIALSAILAALTAGFVGSAHCLGMCGGIAGLYAVHLEQRSLSARTGMALAYNGGRLLTYVMLGAIAGALGGAFAEPGEIRGLSAVLRIAAGALIALIGLQVAFSLSLLAPLERAGSRIWARLAPLTRHVLPVTSHRRALGLGLLWGGLPCGLLYSVLLVAALQGGALQGGLTMLAFGIGTLPAMLLTGFGAQTLGSLLRRRSVRQAGGIVLLVLGLVTMAQPLAKTLGGGGHGPHPQQSAPHGGH